MTLCAQFNTESAEKQILLSSSNLFFDGKIHLMAPLSRWEALFLCIATTIVHSQIKYAKSGVGRQRCTPKRNHYIVNSDPFDKSTIVHEVTAQDDGFIMMVYV